MIDKTKLRKMIADFLLENTVLALATADQQRAPYVFNAFYVHNDLLQLYFVSSKDSLHSLNLDNNQKRASVSIYDPKSAYGTVFGLQGIGSVEVCNIAEIITAGLAYVKKFPAAKEDFVDPATLFDAAYNWRVYKFVPFLYKLRTPEIEDLTGKSSVEYTC